MKWNAGFQGTLHFVKLNQAGHSLRKYMCEKRSRLGPEISWTSDLVDSRLAHHLGTKVSPLICNGANNYSVARLSVYGNQIFQDVKHWIQSGATFTNMD